MSKERPLATISGHSAYRLAERLLSTNPRHSPSSRFKRLRGQIGRASRIGGTTATRAAKTTDFAAGIRPLGAERIVIKGLR
jgi:hypothetical protein